MPTREKIALPQISKSIDDIRASVFGYVELAQDKLAARGYLPTRLNLNKGVVRGLLEIYCWGYWQIYTLLQRLLLQTAPAYATGEWLELHADGVAITRRPATKARGLVRFFRSAQSNDTNVTIPAGRIVRTLPDGTGAVYRYSTVEPAVIAAGAGYAEVLVEAEEYGAASNVSSGQICQLVTPVEGVGTVSNAMGWLVNEGANIETDAQLQERYALQWQANNGCTKYAYKAWALSVPGVTSVSILDQHPRGQGTVDVVVRGADVLPTEALLAKVREAIAPNTPINDDWLVKSPVPTPVTINGTLEYVNGDPDAIKAQAENRIRALFAETSPLEGVTALEIGQDLTRDLLTHTVMHVPGVQRVLWAAPLDDVSIPAAGVARLETLSLQAIAASEA